MLAGTRDDFFALLYIFRLLDTLSEQFNFFWLCASGRLISAFARLSTKSMKAINVFPDLLLYIPQFCECRVC